MRTRARRLAVVLLAVSALVGPAAAAGVPFAGLLRAGNAEAEPPSAAPTAAAGGERVLLVLDRPLTSLDRTRLALAGYEVEREHAVTLAAVARASAGARLSADPALGVARVVPVEALEWHLDRATRLVRAGDALDAPGVTGEGVAIAVVDSGVDRAHPDLVGRVDANLRLVAGGRFLDSPADGTGHGTHVASIAAGSGAASGGRLAGVAPGAHVVGLDISGSFDTAGALAAFDWIFLHHEEHGIRVVVNSWGRVERDEAFDPRDPVVAAADRLVREGIVVVFSASNHGPGPSTLSIEAMNPNVVTVGATDDAGVLASYSSRGPALDASGRDALWVKPDLVAPGTRAAAARAAARVPDAPLLSVAEALDAEGAWYEERSGTSQAAPVVAGAIALMLEANPSLTPAGVANALRESAIDLGEPGPDPGTGFGLLDARDAVRAARGLAPDRRNPLVAGGDESYESDGRFVAATGRALDPIPVTTADPFDGYARLDFPVKPGATRTTFEFRWRPDAAAFRVFLTNGETTYGPWSGAEREGGERVIRGQAPEPLAPGTWTLAARGTAALDVQYTARADVHLAPDPEPPGPLDPRYRLPDSEARGADAFARWWQAQKDEATVRAHVWQRAATAWAAEHPAAAVAASMVAGVVVVGGVGRGWAWALRKR